MRRTLLVVTFLALALLSLPLVTARADDEEKKPATPSGANPVMLLKTSGGDIELELWPKAAPETVKNFIGLAEGTKAFKDPTTGEQVMKPFYDGLKFHRIIKGFMLQGGCPLANGSGGPGYFFKDEINAKGLGLDKEPLFKENRPHPHILGLLDPRNPQLAKMQFRQMVVDPLLKKMGITSQEQLTKRQKEADAKLKSLTLMEVYENQGYKYDDSLEAKHMKKGVIAMANSGANTNGSQFFITLEAKPYLTGKHTVFGKVVKGMDVVEKLGDVAVGPGAVPVQDVKIISIRRK
jgi:peptidyl-prolyl cis-trans isomerase A (cyclophilin A)